MRIKFIQAALEINSVQAEILSEQISDIPDDKLTSFFVFRQGFIEPMKSKELITKEALYSYRAKAYRKAIQLGEYKFVNREEVLEFLVTYYKGKDIGNGLGGFFPYVVIAMDKDGQLINKFAIEEFTQKYRKLDSDDVILVLDDLLRHPQKIGFIERIPYGELDNKEKSIIYIESDTYEYDNIVGAEIKKTIKRF